MNRHSAEKEEEELRFHLKKKKNRVLSWSYNRQNSVVQYEFKQTDKIKRVKTCHIDMEINITEGTY